MAKDVRKRIEQLRAEIRRNDYLYYVLSQPVISDREYDKLFEELKVLEQAHPELATVDSPTQRVSDRPLEGFATVRHPVTMLSMDNTYNADELRAFDERVRKQLEGQGYDYVVELKIDGLAFSLRLRLPPRIEPCLFLNRFPFRALRFATCLHCAMLRIAPVEMTRIRFYKRAAVSQVTSNPVGGGVKPPGAGD